MESFLLQSWYWVASVLHTSLGIILIPVALLAQKSKIIEEIYYCVIYNTSCFLTGDLWDTQRKKLFEQINASIQTQLTNNDSETVTLLEIGVGKGSNFKFYPKGVTVTIVDTNSKCLAESVAEAKKQGVKIEDNGQILGSAENMSSIPDNTFDHVVATVTLCCVKDRQQTLAEIRRVLKPGGKYWLMEFDQYEKGTLRRIFTDAYAVLHKITALGCRAPAQDVRRILEKGGFDTKNLRTSDIEYATILKRTCIGYVQK